MKTPTDSISPPPITAGFPAVAPDPFAGIEDAPGDSDLKLRNDALDRVLRDAVPLRRSFVQKHHSHADRASVLSEFVTGRKTLPLRLLLLVHALEPMLDDSAWTLGAWSKLVGGDRTPDRISSAFRYLANKELIDLDVRGHKYQAQPRHEDGSGAAFVRANTVGADVGHGYLYIPTAFWRTGLADRLKLPGLAMFLVALSETTESPSFQVPLEKMGGWYGISERSAERGYQELAREKILLTKNQAVTSIKSSTLVTHRVHRALAAPYSTAARQEAQQRMKDRQRPTGAPGAGS